MPNLYQRLGVDPDATPAEIRQAYHRAIQRVHPDRWPGDPAAAAAAAELLEAHAVLSDPERRRAYDQQLWTGRVSHAFGEARQAADVLLHQAQQTAAAVEDASRALGRFWRVARRLLGRGG